MTDKIKELIEKLTTQPGCYLMHDNTGEVIYVGKAKNLKNRVSQYFLNVHSGKVAAMVSHVDYFETIVTTNESEAFLLEYNLIHKYMPKYNIMLKDDSHYPYIALRKKEPLEVKISRKTTDKNFYYFGPFPQSTFAKDIVKLINNIFPTKKCTNLPKKPCLYYTLNNCAGYCFQKVDENEFKLQFNEIKDFLNGKTYNKELEVKAEMKKAIDSLNFEVAQEKKNILDAINTLKTKQLMELKTSADCDYFGYSIKDNYICVSLFVYRGGILLGKSNFIYEILDNELDILENVIYSYYQNHIVPKNVKTFNEETVNNLIEVIPNISLGKSKVDLEILNRIIINSDKSLADYNFSLSYNIDKISVLDKLYNLLELRRYPKNIELFDNSHISGSDAVSVSVTFTNGVANKKLYRKYKLNNNKTQSDVDNMYEVLNRRFTRFKEQNSYIPELLLMDGGIQQVNICKELLKKYELDIEVFGLYKDDNHTTKGIISENGDVFEFSKDDPLYLFIKSMQDEVHRFAISFFKKTHLNNYKKSVLDGIEGLGKARKSLVFDTFKTLDDLNNASIDQLSQVLPKEIAKKLFEKLHQND